MASSILDLEEALSIVAHAIAPYGDAYWPLLDRLEKAMNDVRDWRRRLRWYGPIERERRRNPS